MFKTRCAVPLVLLCLGVCSNASAQGDPGGIDVTTVQQLLNRVAELEREIQDLRKLSDPSLNATVAGSAQTASQASEAAKTASSSTDHMDHMNGVEEPGKAMSPIPEIHWFGDVGFRASDQPGETSSFSLGQLDLFMTSTLADHVSILSEIVFRAGTDNKYVVNAERLMLQYSPNPYLALSIGRYHTAIGFYNTAYHHGSWFETAVTRPTMFAYRGGLIPIHDVGVLATGRIPSGPLGLRYSFELGNGQSSQSATAEATQNMVDENNGKAFNVGLISRPERFNGLQLGFSVHRDHLYPASAPKIVETTIAAHAVYQGPAFEWLNEVVAVDSGRPAPASNTTTTGIYTQVSRQIQSFRPYLRLQYIDANQADAFKALGHRYGPTVGVRLDMGKFAAFKVQYERTARRGLPSVNGMATQLAFIF